MNTPRYFVPLAVAGIAAVTLGACGDDEESSSDSTAAPAATAAPATAGAPATSVASATTMAPDMQMVSVEGTDYAFENLPASVTPGTLLEFTNASDVELHELVAIRLPDEETRPVEELIQLPEAEIDAILGDTEPAMVLIAPPGEAAMPVVGDGTLTAPGRYAVVCFIPIGADPAEYMAAAQASTGGPPEVAGGPPHATAGMYGEVVVEDA